MAKALVGSLVEFEFSSGFVYGLCTHDLNTNGQILMMYATLFNERQHEGVFSSGNVRVRTFIHFPLRHIGAHPEVQIIGSKRLSGDELMLPKFRQAGVDGWWIIDGDKEYWVSELRKEMASYPDDGFFSYDIIESWYLNDVYPWSERLLKKGPLAFDLSEFH